MDLPVGDEGPMNGATPVTIVPAPGAGEQHVVWPDSQTIFNADTVPHTYAFQKNKNGTTYVLDIQVGVAAGAIAKLGVLVTLDATDETLEAVYEAPKTTTESVFNSSYGKTS